MLSDPYWTPFVVGDGSSIWWTGRVMAQSSGVGFHWRTFWTPTPPSLTDPLLVLKVVSVVLWLEPHVRGEGGTVTSAPAPPLQRTTSPEY
jgi:hypothetical protein